MKYVPLVAAAAALASACDSATYTAATTRETPRADVSAPSCPAADFAGFLRAFASDDRVRLAHTASVVKVTDWVDADETDRGTATEHVPRERYDDFRLRYRGGRYVHDQHDDMADPIPVQPRVTPIPSGYRVEYIFNMSEGNSWAFAATRGCWQLVADPDPSLL